MWSAATVASPTWKVPEVASESVSVEKVNRDLQPLGNLCSGEPLPIGCLHNFDLTLARSVGVDVPSHYLSLSFVWVAGSLLSLLLPCGLGGGR